MNKDKLKRTGKILVKSLFALCLLGAIALPFLKPSLKNPGNPLSHTELPVFEETLTETYSFESSQTVTPYSMDELLSSIKDFVKTPEGGIPWKTFGETGQTPYEYTDEDGLEWTGLRPKFSDNLKKLDGKEILIQGYMFPLEQEEKQSLFLIGPFPVSCPYHYHSPPNLIIEVHAKTPVTFSYDAVNIKGILELVPKDDEYNVFYRLNEAELAS